MGENTNDYSGDPEISWKTRNEILDRVDFPLLSREVQSIIPTRVFVHSNKERPN